MSKNRDDAQKFATIVRDAGGKIVGRTRLQKLSYLLDLAGLGDGFIFEYRHFGPYSEGLSAAVRDAHQRGIVEEKEIPTSWGGFYSIFTSMAPSGEPTSPQRAALVSAVIDADPVELELAATAAFLFRAGEADPWEETRKRKPEKATRDHLEGAKALYRRVRSVHTPQELPAIV